ncbi:MAG TPA: SurA N-terminal domain-containing protein, partial [Vicinamibacteria bacterium]|nr:SurA N-terminal domain-containing protein [Vicinamibacteria bacterium]
SAPPAAAAPAPTLASASPLPEPLPPVVARVNGRPIPLGYTRIVADEELKGRNPTPAEKAMVYRRAVDTLVVRELMLQEAQRRGVTADPGKVQRMYDAVRSEHPSEDAWKEFLAEKGLDPKAFKDELVVRHTVEALIQKVTGEVQSVPEAEVRAYFEANRANFGVAGKAPTFEQARGQAQRQMLVFKRQEALNALLTRLRGEAKVEVLI